MHGEAGPPVAEVPGHRGNVDGRRLRGSGLLCPLGFLGSRDQGGLAGRPFGGSGSAPLAPELQRGRSTLTLGGLTSVFPPPRDPLALWGPGLAGTYLTTSSVLDCHSDS